MSEGRGFSREGGVEGLDSQQEALKDAIIASLLVLKKFQSEPAVAEAISLLQGVISGEQDSSEIKVAGIEKIEKQLETRRIACSMIKLEFDVHKEIGAILAENNFIEGTPEYQESWAKLHTFSNNINNMFR